MFSLATVYQNFGNNTLADHVEKLSNVLFRTSWLSFHDIIFVAYNALPAALMSDWKYEFSWIINQPFYMLMRCSSAHQYNQQGICIVQQ